MPQDPLKINVVVSGATSTQVKVPTSDNQINVTVQDHLVNVSKTATKEVTTIGFLGIQGPASSSILAPGDDGNILYNKDGYVSGAKTFFYDPVTSEIEISEGSLLLKNGQFILSGTSVDENAFLIRDADGKDLLNVDTQNKKITLSEGALDSEYYVGIGLESPSERLHVGENLRVDGDIYVSGSITSSDGNIYVSGNLVPAVSGVFDLGSLTRSFKDLYLQGETILFVDKNASIGATDSGFSFQVKKEDEAAFEEIFRATRSGLSFSVENAQGVLQEVFSITAENATAVSGMVAGDGQDLTGVHYSGLVDAGIFISKSVPDEAGSMNVNYGEAEGGDLNSITLSYDPTAICAIYPPEGNDNLFFTTITNISRTDLDVSFSAPIYGEGFILNCHISPFNP